MPNRLVRDGIIAGVLGATSVALWFLLVDTLDGHPLQTPNALGRAFFRLLGDPAPGASDLPYVFGYTLFHYLAFILAGLLVAAIVHYAQFEPNVLAGALILLVMFEVGFHALLSVVRNFPVLGVIAWYKVAIANLLAAGVMGTFMWRSHPELREELDHALRDDE